MTTKHILAYGDERIPYEVKTDPRRNTRIAIHVEPDGRVIVDAPIDQPDDLIQKAVHKRSRWIVDHVAQARDRFRNIRPKSYVSGEEVLYLGRRYVLKIIVDDGAIGTARLRGNRLEVSIKSTEAAKIRAIVRAWYRVRAREYFANLIDKQSNRLPWISQPPPFRLLEMTRQWGSCSPSGEIILNPHLIKAPRACVDYVIIHELAHLKHHDHSAEFFDLLSRYSPGWQKPKKLLDQMLKPW